MRNRPHAGGTAAKQMIEVPDLTHFVVRARMDTGLLLKTKDGQPARLALTTLDGRLVEDTPDVAAAVFAAVLNAYDEFMLATGEQRKLDAPPT